jgi:1-acyl-sn-glycerol-3-phosphate acyltransferase
MEKQSFLSRTNLFIRSLLFSIFLPIYTIFYSFLSVSLFPFPLRYRFAMIMAWTRTMIWVLKKLCYVDYTVEGWENIPKDRNGIIMCKHQSTWETFFIPGHFYQPAIILKRELLWVPFFGWGLATIDPIAINRSNRYSAMDQIITKGKKCLDAKRWILVFPEGTRIPPGKIGKYRIGGARLATATSYPILPIAHNAGRYWPKRGFLKKPGTIKVVIGPLIETKNRTPEEVLEETKNWIEGTMRRIDDEGR